MRIAMIGSGYVGLVSGTCFAEIGHHVVCVDRDAGRIAALERGVIPIYEPGLDAMVARNVGGGRLSFTTKLAAVVGTADVVFIAVGTPSRRGDGHAELSQVHAAAGEIAGAVQGFTVVVTKSTVPVGTGDAIEAIIAAARPDADVAVTSNPEFLREGAAIADFMAPDRIVVGTEDPRAAEVMAALYRPLVTDDSPLQVTHRRTAELIKYGANAFLATKITFINEMADLCEAVGADVAEVARGMGLDRRIGPRFLQAGPGYGGSCLPKDTLALVCTAQDHGMSLRVVESVVAANDARKRAMARRVALVCGGSVCGRTVAVLGLTFKPGTDDVRDSPAIAIIDALQQAGARIRAHDPVGMDQARRVLRDVELAPDPYACADSADVLVLVTDWAEYRRLDLGRLRRAMRALIVIDLRNVLAPEAAARHGFTLLRVGGAAQLPAPGLRGVPAVTNPALTLQAAE